MFDRLCPCGFGPIVADNLNAMDWDYLETIGLCSGGEGIKAHRGNGWSIRGIDWAGPGRRRILCLTSFFQSGIIRNNSCDGDKSFVAFRSERETKAASFLRKGQGLPPLSCRSELLPDWRRYRLNEGEACLQLGWNRGLHHPSLGTG